MTYQELVEEIKGIFMQADVSEVQDHIAYQFNIEGEAEGAFYVEVSQGQLSIEPYEYYDRDVLFTTTADTLLKIAQGKSDAVKAFTLGKLKVEGDFDKALLLQRFSSDNKKKVTAERKAAEAEKKAAADKKAAEKKTAQTAKTAADKKPAAEKAVKRTVSAVKKTAKK